ncbi:hypothetical protein [Pseudochryseolinea flava]|nr:hypothetical protein [Pseudochryseolinea flava]
MKSKILEFLNSVTDKNFQESYADIVDVAMPFKGIVSKEQLNEMLAEIFRENEFSDFADEILVDFGYRVFGLCPPNRVIEWN